MHRPVRRSGTQGAPSPAPVVPPPPTRTQALPSRGPVSQHPTHPKLLQFTCFPRVPGQAQRHAQRQARPSRACCTTSNSLSAYPCALWASPPRHMPFECFCQSRCSAPRWPRRSCCPRWPSRSCSSRFHPAAAPPSDCTSPCPALSVVPHNPLSHPLRCAKCNFAPDTSPLPPAALWPVSFSPCAPPLGPAPPPPGPRAAPSIPRAPFMSCLCPVSLPCSRPISAPVTADL